MVLYFFIYFYPEDIWDQLDATICRTLYFLLRMNPTLFREGAVQATVVREGFVWKVDLFSFLTPWYIHKKLIHSI